MTSEPGRTEGRLGELDRPATPEGSGAWDEQSVQWFVGDDKPVGDGGFAGDERSVGDGGFAGDKRSVEDGGFAEDERSVGDEHSVGDEEADLGTRGAVPDGWSATGTASASASTPAGASAGASAGAPGDVPVRASVPAARPSATPRDAGDPPGHSRRSPGRRNAVDPVKALMHRHRELCERAVDPLEIAAGLEAHGMTDRTATRFRHRDVFSLAEEMYARRARDVEPSPRSAPAGRSGARAGWAVLALLPGILCAATVTGLRFTEGRAHLAVAATGTLAVLLGLRAALRHGPLGTAHHTTNGTRAWTCWLIAYALLGDGLLSAALSGGPDEPWPPATAPVLALALSCAPAAWCAHLFMARARRGLAASRGLEEFAVSVRPLLLGAFALYLCVLGALLALCGAALDEPPAYAGAIALGALLLLARLLAARGFTHAPAVVLGAAGAAEATATATVFGGRLPGCSFLGTPVETVAYAWGPGAVPALVCGAGALVLLIHATRTLTRASAHAAPDGTP
ncbi:hypothetical protein [Streptomyces sp. NPDC059466]|uniref:hypothetical protein n=1 Tax=unclassified Streptomyces TaxID=2593676 RepID=UPI00369F1614